MVWITREWQLATGFTAGGVGWYRARLPLSALELAQLASGRRHLALLFDGVYGRTDAWLVSWLD